MPVSELLILLAVGLTSGLMNSVAGGGSFVSFPALIFFGLSPITANATSTMALVPGTFATMFAYRNELKIHNKKLPLYIFLSLAGGLFGAVLLLYISNQAFAKTVPYLIFLATILFSFKTHIIGSVNRIFRLQPDQKNSKFHQIFMLFLFILIAIYGGFFGAGMGIMMLAVFSLMGMTRINEMNALRSCCGLASNFIAMVVFGASGIISWPHALTISVGAITGGYFGAFYARKLPNEKIRNIVIIIGWTMTIYFFCKEYGNF